MPSSPWNLPNMLSLFRVILVPVILVFLTLRGQLGYVMGLNVGDCIAAVVFIIASITDAVDGYIARKRNIVTNLGKFIDPLADKILVIAVLTALVELHRFPAWMVVVIISREFIVSGLRMVAASEGVVIAASKGGKLKTVTQIIGPSALQHTGRDGGHVARRHPHGLVRHRIYPQQHGSAELTENREEGEIQAACATRRGRLFRRTRRAVVHSTVREIK